MSIKKNFFISFSVIFLFLFSVNISFSDISGLNKSLTTQKISGNKTSSKGRVYRTGGVGLNFRTGAWGKIMTVLPEGKEFNILGKEGDWYKVDVDGKKGYVHSDYVTKTDGNNSTKKASGTMYVNVGESGGLNVRTSPWGKIIKVARRGEKVKIIGKNGDWYKVKIDGKVAYMHGSYLSKNKINKKIKIGITKVTNTDTGGSWGGVPCKGRITSNYGWRTHPIRKTRSFHKGIDIGAPAGTPCKSLGPGKVIFAGWNDGYGRLVKIQHDNGLVSYYGHLKSFNVKSGQRVGQNTTVAFVNSTGSSTGNHLHFEIRKNGKSVNPKSVPGVRF